MVTNEERSRSSVVCDEEEAQEVSGLTTTSTMYFGTSDLANGASGISNICKFAPL